MAERRERAAISRQVVELGQRGCLTDRDELLLQTLAEVEGMTLGQARRLLWAAASPVVAYQRLNRLRSWGLLTTTPLPPAAAGWGLGPGPVYQLGPAGQLWLKPQAELDWRGRAGRWTEPLLGTELLVRLAVSEWKVAWLGPAAAQARLRIETPLAGLGQWGQGQLLFHVAGLWQQAVDWAALVRAFDQAARGGPGLPPAALLLPDGGQVGRVAELIETRRRGRVSYLLASWSDLVGADRLTSAPVWRYLPPGRAPLAGQSLAGLASADGLRRLPGRA